MERLFYRTTRRGLFGSLALGVVVAPLIGNQDPALATPEADAGERSAGAPNWQFVAQTFQDPYNGQIQAPPQPPAGTRFVAAEVEVINDSDQSLDFTPLDIRLRSDSSVEFRGGSAIGTEPTINPRNLNPGERSRGWVWFIVPEEIAVTELVYVGPPPQFRIPLPL